MEIKFHGHACFSIKEGKVTMVTDPYGEATGLKLPKLLANLVTVSHQDPAHQNTEGVEGEPRVFDWPGEYEISGVYLKGVHSFHDPKESKVQRENTVFHITWNGIRLCHLGAQGTKLTPQQLEKVGEVDVLFVPVGGQEGIDAKKAKEIVEQMEPRVVIPMTYHTEGSKGGLGSLESFLSVMGAKSVEPLDSFTFKKSELPEDTSRLVVLNS